VKTEPRTTQPTREKMISDGYTPSAVDAIMFIRSRSDTTIVAAARRPDSGAHAAITAASGPDTNPYWVTLHCAEEAYARGLIGEAELDRITK
jgi:hypothetical protein